VPCCSAFALGTTGWISVLCVHLDTGVPWSTAVLRGGATLSIEKSDFGVPHGIHDVDYDAARQVLLVVVGRSISGAVPFELCT
jgi:hypothetical protein